MKNPFLESLDATPKRALAPRYPLRNDDHDSPPLTFYMNKLYNDATSALAGLLHDDQLLAVGGFGLCGIPEALIEAVLRSDVKNLKVRLQNAFGLEAPAYQPFTRRWVLGPLLQRERITAFSMEKNIFSSAG
jgi:hypothetical protein